MKPTRLLFVFIAVLSVVLPASAAELSAMEGGMAARSFLDTSQIVSRFQTELYAHQCSMRMANGIGYVAYQCNERSPDENVAGQLIRLSIFNLLSPAATARWVDVCAVGDSSNGLAIAGNAVGNPILHLIGEETLRIFFTARLSGDPGPSHRVLYRDYNISTGLLSDLRQARCSIAQTQEPEDLVAEAVQRHLDFLFGEGFGAKFARGLSLTCDMVPLGDALYSTVQIKNSEGGKTLLMTNVLMRSQDEGATWELLGAPDPRLLPADVKVLAEPVLTADRGNVYLHLRSNVIESGYVLTRTAKANPFAFTAPVTKWGYGIGRPAICDFGKPIGLVAMFAAPSVGMGGSNSVSRNRCEVVQIDAS